MRITKAKLLSYGFKCINHGDCSPYESLEKDDINVWDFNGQFWIVDALDQAAIDVEFKTVGQLSAFFKACGRHLTKNCSG